MKEAELHRLLTTDKSIQRRMLKVLGINGSNIVFNSEDQYPNGMYADITILSDDKVRAIVELKGSDIGVNEFVRGTGQIFQYKHFIDLNLSIKSYIFNDAVPVYCFPSSLISSKHYNIGLFAYPKGCIILEFNEINHTFRKITDNDLRVFAGSRGREMVTISPYYIRDNRLFELYIALKYFNIFKLCGFATINRAESEDFLKQLNVPNNGNWRNAFISLSSLGLTDENNIPTDVGSEYANMSFDKFAYEIYNSYIRNYFDVVYTNLLLLNSSNTPITQKQLKDSIDASFQNREVMFLTDSDNRYLSSWLNIMKDDFGCIDFEPHKAKRKYLLNYPIDKFNENSIRHQIKEKTIAYPFIDAFNRLMSARIKNL